MKFNLTIKGLQVNKVVETEAQVGTLPVFGLEEISVGQEYAAEDIINIQNNTIGHIKSAINYITNQDNVQNIMNIIEKVDAFDHIHDMQTMDRARERANKEKETGIRFASEEPEGETFEEQRQRVEKEISEAIQESKKKQKSSTRNSLKQFRSQSKNEKSSTK